MATFSVLQSPVDQYDSSDLDENKTFEELISEYNEVGTLTPNQLNTSNICNTNNESSETKLDEDYALLNPDNISIADSDVKNTEMLRSFLDKECYGNQKWLYKIIFPGSIDKKNYENLDITKYVGDIKFKERSNSSNVSVYFDPIKYPVEEELKARSNTPSDTPVELQVQQQFKRSAYIWLSKDLRVASGQCRFNIVQNGNRKFVSKSTHLVI